MKDMTDTVKKYADEEQFPRMRGTCGHLDYLIIAKKPEAGLQLGIKVMCGPGKVGGQQGFLVGFRLRSAPIPGANVQSIDDQEVKQQSPDEGWDFPWEKHPEYGYNRASLIRVIALNRNPTDIEWAMDDLDSVRFFGKMQEFLHDKVPAEQFVVTDDDIADYIRASIYPIILQFAAGSDPKAALELLDLEWNTKVENHAQFEEQYKAKRQQLLDAIEAMEKGGEATYQPKPAFGDGELVSMNNVVGAMLEGAKPKLEVVGGTDNEEVEEFGSMDDADTAPGEVDGGEDDGFKPDPDQPTDGEDPDPIVA